MMNVDKKNIDYAEQVKFDAMADEWWNPYGKCKPLHDINPLRLEFIQTHMPLKNKKILDIGCGGGILTESMAKNGAEVVGIDIAPEVLNVATMHAKQQNLSIQYLLTTAEDFSQQHQQSFDAITCMELLEHIPNPTQLVQNCVKLIKPDGHLFLSTLNRNLKSFLFAIVGAEYILNLLPKGTHEYAKFIKPSELSQILRHAGFNLHDMVGISYQPLIKKYRLSQDVSVNYLAYATLSG